MSETRITDEQHEKGQTAAVEGVAAVDAFYGSDILSDETKALIACDYYRAAVVDGWPPPNFFKAEPGRAGKREERGG